MKTENITAESFIKNNIREDFLWEDMNNLTNCPIEDAAEIMIEFAKLKVTEALQCASEKAKILKTSCGDSMMCGCQGNCEAPISYINKHSILNSYDLTQIK
jgi:hypothetical protein